MIQRKQTIWLLISMLAWIILFFKPVIGFTGEGEGPWMLHAAGIREAETGKMVLQAIPLLILYILVLVLTLGSILLFKARNLQLRITLYTMILQILSYALIGLYILMGKKQLDADPRILFLSIVPLVSCFFSWLAFRGIRMDILMLKTLNRLR